MSRLLVVTAVAAERDAVLSGHTSALGMLEGIEVHRAMTAAGLLDVVVSGVGAVAAALAAHCALRQGYDLAISAGIAGGFAPITPGQVTVADSVVDADAGAETADGFTSMAELGWGPVEYPVDTELAELLARRCQATLGTILTVSTTTGTQARAARLSCSYPAAVAEAMEGFGVRQAASRTGVAFAEVRAISNMVGPRDRDGWRVGEALAALASAFSALLAEPVAAPARLR